MRGHSPPHFSHHALTRDDETHSNANLAEIIATAELGCQHVTILADHIKELQETPLDQTALNKYPIFKNPPAKKQAPYYANYTTPERLQGHMGIDPLSGPGWDGKLASTETDWLANDGEALSRAMEADPAVVRKMKDVLGAFGGADVRAKAAIESEMAKLN